MLNNKFGLFHELVERWENNVVFDLALLTLDAFMGWGTTSIPAEEVAVGKPGKWAWWLGGEAGKWAWLGGDAGKWAWLGGEAEEADSGRCVRP